MTDKTETSSSFGTLSRPVWFVLLLLAGGLMLAHLTGNVGAWLLALVTTVTEGGLAALIFIAAGGYGVLMIRRVAPASAPRMLTILTGCALGLWMLGTVMLAVGTWVGGSLTPWLWWPIVAAGVVLAAWQGKSAIEGWKVPPRFDGRALVWVVVALAVGMWLAGATRPPGCWTNAGDEYDVLEYHFQVPREYYQAGRISPLKHNVYSHYPLGLEMLYLLGMCLRSGPYEGMYVAKLLHGGMGVLTVMALFAALRRDDETRGRFAAVLVATAPFVIYMSWLGMVELGMLFHLALAVLWLREWLRGAGARAAWCLGVALGGGCAMKYLSVGFLAGPVAVVMGAMALAKVGKLRHVGATVLATGVLFSPWLIRNTAATGNPVFPLATGLLGKGHWSEESNRRWVAGHGPALLTPVPEPEGFQPAPAANRAQLLFRNLLHPAASQWFGTVTMMIAGVAICAVLASGAKADPWDWALLGVLVLQLVVWCAFTHGMPSRFILPALIPMALLAAGGLARLAEVKGNPFRRASGGDGQGIPFGRPPAVTVLAAALLVNLVSAYLLYAERTTFPPPFEPFRHAQGVPGEMFARNFPPPNVAYALPEGSRIMLVGEAKAFYYPKDAIYATVFDEHPLARMQRENLPPRRVLAELRERGVTHIWVDWSELWRLANTYGCWSEFSRDLFACWRDQARPGLTVLEQLRPHGLRVEEEAPPFAARLPYWDPEAESRPWPWLTIYALPWAPTTQPTSPPAARAE